MHRFEEETVVPALGATPGAAGPEALQHRRPILLCHPRQHGRLLPNRPAKCHRSTNVGIHSPHTQPNPSTRPNVPEGTEGASADCCYTAASGLSWPFAPPHQRTRALQVLVRDNNVDQALRVLKKKMQREGVFREMKARKAYEKPSE